MNVRWQMLQCIMHDSGIFGCEDTKALMTFGGIGDEEIHLHLKMHELEIKPLKS